MRKPVVKVDNEKGQNTGSVLRAFTKRVQTAGTLKHARTLRYHGRAQSDLSKKKGALKRMGRRIEIQKLLKMGKAIPTKSRRR